MADYSNSKKSVFKGVSQPSNPRGTKRGPVKWAEVDPNKLAVVFAE